MDHYDTDRVGTILFSGMAKEESSTNSDSSLSPLLSEDLQSSGDTDEEDESNSNGETSDNENDQSYSSKMTNLHPEKQSTHTGKEETTKDRGSRLHSIQIPKINTKMLRSGYSEQEATVKTEFPKPHGTKRKKAISKRALRRRITKLNELRRKSKDRERALEERVVEVEGEKAILEKEKREMAMNFGKAQEHSMNQWKKQEVDVMPDDIVRIKFQDLIGKCRNCLNKPYFVKSVDDWPKISSLVMNMLSAKQGGKTWTSGRFSAAVAAGKVSIRTILMAKMSRMLREILDDHFFWLQPRKDEQVSKNAGATLQWVEDLGRKGK